MIFQLIQQARSINFLRIYLIRCYLVKLVVIRIVLIYERVCCVPNMSQRKRQKKNTNLIHIEESFC